MTPATCRSKFHWLCNIEPVIQGEYISGRLGSLRFRRFLPACRQTGRQTGQAGNPQILPAWRQTGNPHILPAWRQTGLPACPAARRVGRQEILISSNPHILKSSYPQILTSSNPHILKSSHPPCLPVRRPDGSADRTSSNPHILKSSHPPCVIFIFIRRRYNPR